MTIADFVGIVQSGGITALVLVILIGGAKEWWVYGTTYRRMVRDRDDWREIALSGTEIAERLTKRREE